SPAKQKELQSYLDDYAERRIDTLPWQTVQGLMAGESYLKSEKIYSVARRFDLSTIFVVTLAYSLLFGAIKALSCPPAASAMIAGFILIVAAAQAVLFQGKNPRMASIITGAVIYSVGVIAAWLYNGPRLYSVWQILIPGGFVVAGGGML